VRGVPPGWVHFRRGCASPTAGSQAKLLSTLITDAVDARFITSNPVHRQRSPGSHLRASVVERVWSTP
jgi:hypothetical protein